MYFRCQKCKRGYDDAKQWTICPHSPLGHPVDDLCPLCDTLRSVHGACSHQQEADIANRTPVAARLVEVTPDEEWHGIPLVVEQPKPNCIAQGVRNKS